MITADYIADLSVIWKQSSLVYPYFDRNEVDLDRAYRIISFPYHYWMKSVICPSP